MYSQAKPTIKNHNTQSAMIQFLSSRLSERQFNVMAMHCARTGIKYTKMMGNRLHVDCSSDSIYTGLIMLELHGVTQL